MGITVFTANVWPSSLINFFLSRVSASPSSGDTGCFLGVAHSDPSILEERPACGAGRPIQHSPSESSWGLTKDGGRKGGEERHDRIGCP